MSQSRFIYSAVAIFLVVLLASWLTHGRGVIRDDPERHIAIPAELMFPLTLQVAYNDEDIYFRYRWPAERPHLYIDLLRYSDGKWVRQGSPPIGSQREGLYEDRVTMLVDDGSVPNFKRYGGYITVHRNYRYFTDQADPQEVRDHPHLGQKLGASDLRKSLPGTRHDPNDWRTVVDEDTLARQREAGYFLDLWHWRAHRSNPIGASDDQHVAEYRHGDAGKGPYFTNWDSEAEQPKLMFDPDQTGMRAMDWEDVRPGEPVFDEIYYLSEDMAVPFDPDHAWQEGDTIPRRVLRQPEGSRGTIAVAGQARWKDGYWDVALVRAKDTGYPLDDKIFRDQGVYDIAVAVHRNATGSRWHYVSLPLEVGLGRAAEVQAHRFSGENPDWEAVESHTLSLYYPGQVNWTSLMSRAHAGAEDMRQGVPVRVRHSPEQLAYYGVEHEFQSEIQRQWLWTLVGGVLLIIAFAVAVRNLMRLKGEG